MGCWWVPSLKLQGIAFIPLLNQIFDDKNKNGSLKEANNNQVYKNWKRDVRAHGQNILRCKKKYLKNIMVPG